jgi:hypothetical protein
MNTYNSKRSRRKPIRPRLKIGEQFVYYSISMLKAEPFRSLTLTERKILHRLEIENASHAGKDNGTLVCTYEDFVKYGVRRASLLAALNRLENLGFIEVVVKGRMAWGNLRVPSKYRLTYLPTYQTGGWIPPTNEWRRKQNTGPRNGTGTAPRNGTGKPRFSSTETELQPHLKTEPLSGSRGGRAGARGTGEQPKSPQPPLSTGEEVIAPPPLPGLIAGSSIVLPPGGTLQ